MPQYEKGDHIKLTSEDFAEVLKVLSKDDDAEKSQYEVMIASGETRIVLGKDIQTKVLSHIWYRKRAHLTDFESDTLDKYTGPTYKEWNRVLRAGEQKTPEIEALQAVITKAVKYKGPVFRGLSFSTKELRDAYLSLFSNPTYQTPQFMSTSKSTHAALTFAQGNYGVLMRIYCGGQNGAILRTFTGNDDLGENEVLFKYGSRFVVRESSSRDVSSNQGSWYIHLTEEGTTEPAAKKGFEIPVFKPKGGSSGGDGSKVL